jgi:molybdopterin-containing oxidoreductase family iron-sulfur binding subunit
METTRRGFLQAAGLAGLGLVIAMPAVELFKVMSGSSPSSSELSTAATQRLAMVIDINKCNEYKQENGDCHLCEVACHRWHKVPTHFTDPEEEIKWIWEEKYGKVFEEHLIEHLSEDDEVIKNLPIKLLCNQCTNPTCVKYCPTRATWKRESDGIIMIDMHRCIGCRYCMAGCPYGARSFNWGDPRKFLTQEDMDPESDFPTRTRGVVEKCNFCADIIEFDDNGDAIPGHEPKCVAACEAGALIFGDLLNQKSRIWQLLDEHKEHIMRRFPELENKPNNYYIL